MQLVLCGIPGIKNNSEDTLAPLGNVILFLVNGGATIDKLVPIYLILNIAVIIGIAALGNDDDKCIMSTTNQPHPCMLS